VSLRRWKYTDHAITSEGAVDAYRPVLLNGSGVLDSTLLYASGTWTPALTFGGGATGLTYSSRGGEYQRIGALVFFSMALALSAKGSSTGAPAISLPVALASDTQTFVFACRAINMTVAGIVLALALANTQAIIFRIDDLDGTFTTPSEAHFTATSTLQISGHYRAA